MLRREDLFIKAVLAMALSRSGNTDTEVEVTPSGPQRLDVFSEPDPALSGELVDMGMLGKLGARLAIFEPFSKTPNLRRARACYRKQYVWHHQLERRARAEARERGDKLKPVPFPTLVFMSPGNPKTLIDQYRFERMEDGLYVAPPGLASYVVVLSELPKTRATVLLRLGSKETRPEAAREILESPLDTWERRIGHRFLVEFELMPPRGGATKEESMTGAELLRQADAAAQRLLDQGKREGERKGERNALLKLLRARFGEVPPTAVARIEAAEPSALEAWIVRVLTAQSLADVFQ